ncbi:hypothetical protein [Acanthopleuribacter pedis]|uniref:Uncharacterized protein n=1 Tax=Acanthopleuribacter pedis TaxID=442870 RepID=A0A8J7QJB9_9BACT|nr:hypothetical protein [Acanthopleuribacter pedis]MBO1323475.1 hypothetical protein [Acanthopleuribacter pedis]
MKEVDDVVRKLTEVLSVNKFNWWDVARQLTVIRDRNLWRQSESDSWTSWIKELASNTNRHHEGYFKMIGAYNYYANLVDRGGPITSICETQLSKDCVMAVKGIARGNVSTGRRLLLDVSLGRYGRRHLKLLNQAIGREWEREKIRMALFVGEVACLIEKSKPFQDERRHQFFGRTHVSKTVVFDCVEISRGEGAKNFHGVIVRRPGEALDQNLLADAANYVDYLWLASNAKEQEEGSFGLLRFDLESTDISIERTPLELKRPNKKVRTAMCVL